MSELTSPTSETTVPLAYPCIGLHIDGRWIHDRTSYQVVRNPSDEAVIGEVPQASSEDVLQAVDAAARGFLVWRDMAPLDRARIMQRAAALLRERAECIALTITLENGKTLADARAEVERSASFFDWDSAESLRAYGHIVPGEPGMQKLVVREPIGPVAAFTPWNVPLSAPSRKVSAALGAGCSIVLKAAEETPGAACHLVQCFVDAGLPAGVLNLVLGNPEHISTTLIAQPAIRMVSLTGSIQVGRNLAQLAAMAMKPVLMELGGHAPVLVCDGVDAAEIGRLAALASTRVNGQVCASPSRFIVHEAMYETFVASMARATRALRVGDGLDPQTQVGPVANARRLAAMESLVLDATRRGGRVVAGGHRMGEKGFFFAPTVLANLPAEAAAMSVEPFGPIASCVTMADLDEGLAIANSLSVGLAAYAFSNRLEEAERIGRELACGVLSINHFGAPDADTPFGGVKESGFGREGGASALDAYLVTKTVLQRCTRV